MNPWNHLIHGVNSHATGRDLQRDMCIEKHKEVQYGMRTKVCPIRKVCVAMPVVATMTVDACVVLAEIRAVW